MRHIVMAWETLVIGVPARLAIPLSLSGSTASRSRADVHRRMGSINARNNSGRKRRRSRDEPAGSTGRHRFHGAPERFDVVADLVADRFHGCRFAADVAGGQGMLARRLAKAHNIETEVIDPRGWVLTGVASRQEEFLASMAPYYDVIVGLHPDQAIREVVGAAAMRPTLLVPCCNFWDTEQRLGRDELLAAVTEHHRGIGGTVEQLELAFRGPHNLALVLEPPKG